ncbi:MAG: carotenoid oxygenase family protein [Pleurocapsa sp. MO_192.B19]|nr:carotenoid oxygenase family protein [Pleurocapsa sp. MO_192.B19]
MSQSPLEPLEATTPNNSEQSLPSRFPQTIVAVSREEFIDPVKLTIRDADGHETTLPHDLHGHFFIVSPVGSSNSSSVEGDEQVVWVTKNGWTPIYNGDGMVYRFSFDQGNASLKTRFIKPPCYYADLATVNETKGSQYKDLAFQNLGISRVSLNKLGVRNQLNTAFVPFKLSDDESERLLVTWDVGRPYEVDPETLETLTPVGKNQDWEDFLPSQQAQPFKQVMSSAHPVFDFKTGELFTVNVGKSIWTMLALSRSLKERLTDHAVTLKSSVNKSNESQGIQGIFLQLYSLFLGIVRFIVNFLGLIEKIVRSISGGYDFVHLLAWDGKQVGIKCKWNVVLPRNRSLKIDQTVHQMGLTRDYLIFAETSFKFSLENILPFQKNYLATAFKILLADFIDYPQYPSTKLYIVKRADLKPEAAKTNKFAAWFSRSPFKHLPKVVAQEVEIAPEFSHYLVDYDNPNNQIVVHISHLAATDVAEYIRIFDRSAYDDRDHDDIEDKYDDPELTYRLQKLAGNVVSPMDISRLGRWVIDGETGKVIDKQLRPNKEDRELINQQLADHQLDPKYSLTWSSAFYVYQDQRLTEKFTDIFWNSWGCWPDTLTERNVAAYKRYSQRLVDLDKLVDLTYKGVPSSLCHLKIRINSDDKIEIEIDPDNYYQFNNQYLGTSAQFIPRPDAEDQTDGYIACVVLTSDEFLSQSDRKDNDPEWSRNSEIWLFDARKLRHGPLYKLSHPQLNIGASFHATWLAEAKSPSKRLDYDVKEDYEYLVEQLIKNQPELGDKIRQLFDREIYPRFK